MSYADGLRPVGVISHGSGGYPGDSIPYRVQYSLLLQLDAGFFAIVQPVEIHI
jgi:hypothetical protein